jgi:hypothetical protein
MPHPFSFDSLFATGGSRNTLPTPRSTRRPSAYLLPSAAHSLYPFCNPFHSPNPLLYPFCQNMTPLCQQKQYPPLHLLHINRKMLEKKFFHGQNMTKCDIPSGAFVAYLLILPAMDHNLRPSASLCVPFLKQSSSFRLPRGLT